MRMHYLAAALAVVGAAVLTCTHKPKQAVAPAIAAVDPHPLGKLELVATTLAHIQEEYVDPARINPRKMVTKALEAVQFSIPEVLAQEDAARGVVALQVGEAKREFAVREVSSPSDVLLTLRPMFEFIGRNMDPNSKRADVEYAAVNGILSTLDPHSVLLDPESARDMDVSISGKFGGLGIVIRMVNRKLTIIRPMPDTPAWRAGLRSGDQIVKIGNEPTDNLTTDESIDRMRGEPGTSVTLTIGRKGAASFEKRLERDIIRVASVHAKLLADGVGVLRVTQFNQTTGTELRTAMADLRSKGARGWVLDLRGNPGGLLQEAIRIVDEFVNDGTIVAQVTSTERQAAGARPGADPGSVVVLVNGGSASASEIVAGALKNLGRGIVIGTRTFGKGSVQELSRYENGAKLKLTTAQYLTPGDKSIQSVGIAPDIELRRMLIPAQNTTYRDLLRLLPPSKSYGEKDLDEHLTSDYVQPDEQAAYVLPFVYEKPTNNAPLLVDPMPGDDEDDGPEEIETDDDIKEDFEIRFARRLAASVAEGDRAKLLQAAATLVTATQKEEEQKQIARLAKLGVDWLDGSSVGANLMVELSTTAKVAAGDVVRVTATVKNMGTAPAHRVLVRLPEADGVFRDAEFPLGLVPAGASRTFTGQFKLPAYAPARTMRLHPVVASPSNVPVTTCAATLKVEAKEKPQFAYTTQLIDDGNGDGLVQAGESYRYMLRVQNSGRGDAPDTSVLLRNDSGDGVILGRSRYELGMLPVGKSVDLEFPFATTNMLKKELVLEVMVFDNVLGTQTSEKLRVPVRPPLVSTPITRHVKLPLGTKIREGAHASSQWIAKASGGTFPVTATVGEWTRLDLGGRAGFVPTVDAVDSLPEGMGTLDWVWHSTPPTIEVAQTVFDTDVDVFPLVATATDDQRIEDVFVIVSNDDAKIDGRKVAYRSNRASVTPGKVELTVQVPLWSGTNEITVIARESDEVRTAHTLYVRRLTGPEAVCAAR